MLERLSTLPTDIDLPVPLRPLERRALNIYWSWHPEVRELFKEISPTLWAQRKGPVNVLRQAESLAKFAGDRSFVKNLNGLARAFDTYLADTSETGFANSAKSLTPDGPVAYF